MFYYNVLLAVNVGKFLRTSISHAKLLVGVVSH